MLAVVFPWCIVSVFHIYIYTYIDYREKNLSLSESIPYARPWILNQLTEGISLEDPIHVSPNSGIETDVKDLLLSKCRKVVAISLDVLKLQNFQKLLNYTSTTQR